MTDMSEFGSRRIYYNNFASHLLNAFNPNMLHPGLIYQWTNEDWYSQLEMLKAFGFNVFEFWLEPRLFCREGLEADFGKAFTRQINSIIHYAHEIGVQVEMICSLATVGAEWITLCPNIDADWDEIQYLWIQWTRQLPDLDIIGIFPGDPGACSLNGCTALTYIDKSIEIANQINRNHPNVEIEFNTWGPPFFGWGNIEGPKNWKGEFVQSYQHTAWNFDRRRADESMAYLIERLPDFPSTTSISINLGFNGDGNPSGEQDARFWVREIAKTHPVQGWDFSLTEGENNIVPHFRFDRLFSRRKLERESAPYRGGICFTMTPLLNQLSLYESAQSFINPDADPEALARNFYSQLFGKPGEAIVDYLPLFEVIKDWGNYHQIEMPRSDYHTKMMELKSLVSDLEGHCQEANAFHPTPEIYRQNLLFFADFYSSLSSVHPDYDNLYQRYWDRVYLIYDQLPEHVDPRPKMAVNGLINYFKKMG